MDFESLSRRLMDAATDPALWTTAIDEVALQGNAEGAVLLPLKGRARTVPKSASLEEGLKSYVQDGWHLRDNRDKGIPLLKTQAAEQLGISYETARTQLKSIFDRTDTRRQSELIGLVRRLKPTLRS